MWINPSPEKSRSAVRIGLWLLTFVMLFADLFENAQAETDNRSTEDLKYAIVLGRGWARLTRLSNRTALV